MDNKIVETTDEMPADWVFHIILWPSLLVIIVIWSVTLNTISHAFGTTMSNKDGVFANVVLVISMILSVSRTQDIKSYSWFETLDGIAYFVLKAIACGVVMVFGFSQPEPVTSILIVLAGASCLLSKN